MDITKYAEGIINVPRAIDAQPHAQEGECIWCEDWEIVEICKYFINGRELYLQDPPPRRLRNNSLWSQEDIMAKGERLIKDCKTMDTIISHFKGLRDEHL